MNTVIMPKAGMAMEEGTIVKWLKKEGDPIKKGEILLEIETDKTNMEVESDFDGILLQILHKEGDVVPVIEAIAYIGEAGEKVPAGTANKQIVSPVAAKPEVAAPKQEAIFVLPQDGRIPATPLAKTLAKQMGISLLDITAQGGIIHAKDVMEMKKSSKKATPLAQRIAKDQGIDLSSVLGSGVQGKIYTKDLPLGLAVKRQVAPPKKVSGMRKVIAKRMSDSHREAPPVTQHMKADVTKLVELREEMKQQRGSKITLNDFVIKAVAKALEEMPEMNAHYIDDAIIEKQNVNIGVAVALDEGLIVPVIKDANTLTLNEVSKIAKQNAIKAREGKLLPDEYTGGTFTITNLGMFGVTMFTPIINLPEIAILGVCAMEDVLDLDEKGKLYKKKMMGFSLTYDHRATDGAKAAIFMQKVIARLEAPLTLVDL